MKSLALMISGLALILLPQISLALAADDAPTMADYSEYSKWSREQRYITDLRQIYIEFEAATKPNLKYSDQEEGEVSWQDWLPQLLMPTVHADDEEYCPIGGGERKMIEERGQMRCPTKGRACGSFRHGDTGFRCFSLFDNACVPRFPVGSITERCERASKDKLSLNLENYQKVSQDFSTIYNRCEANEYDARFKKICSRFSARLFQVTLDKGEGRITNPENVDKGGSGQNEKEGSDTGEDEPAQKQQPKPGKGKTAEHAPGAGKPAPKPSSQPDAAEPKKEKEADQHAGNDSKCFPRQRIRIEFAHGGNLNAFRRWAKRIAQAGLGMEIVGACHSACAFMLPNIPKEHICVGPKAMLGLHCGYSEIYHRTDCQMIDDAAAEDKWPSDFLTIWNRMKAQGGPLQIKPVKGELLRSMYQSCDERSFCNDGKKPMIRVTSGPVTKKNFQVDYKPVPVDAGPGADTTR